MDPYIRKTLSQCGHHASNILIGTQCGMGGPVQQYGHDNLVVFGTGDYTNQILILLVEAVEQHQLLLTVSWVVKDIDV